MEIESIGNPAIWIGFGAFVLLMLVLDLGVFHRKAHEIRFREALGWTCVWISLAVFFNLFIYFKFGTDRALEFLTGYLIEEALSVDNLFVFLIVFSFFSVPRKYQHRVLFYGILGALIMRGIFILIGAKLIHDFHWIIYIFGAMLVFTGVKLYFQRGLEVEPQKNIIIRFLRSIIPSVSTYREERFFVRESGKLLATPLFFVLLTLEFTDLVFAIDSIPAIFAITTDPFIVFTSNIFAIMGLRSLYFVIEGAVTKLHYLKAGLSAVLCFVGTKMLISYYYKIPILISLLIVASILLLSVVLSLIHKPSEKVSGA